MLKKKPRYKPLYKKFIRLRKNIQNKEKINKTNFSKKKWINLINFLNKQLNRRKKKFRVYDLNSYYVKKYGNIFKKKFLLHILNKQSFSLFYGHLKNSYFKKLIQLSQKKKNKQTNFRYVLNILESRLDSVLYRSQFTTSLREARHLITHGHVLLNSIKIKNNKYGLSKGDLVSINSRYIKKFIKNNVLYANMWPMPPESMLINYKLLIILYLGESKLNIYFNKFPFYINYNNVINYYRKN